MEKYWIFFWLGLIGAFAAFGGSVLFLLWKRNGRIRYLSSLVFLVIAVVMTIELVIPLAKDYPMAAAGEYIEVEVTTIEFVGSHRNMANPFVVDSYGSTLCYVHDTDEYVVFPFSDVRVSLGKTYRIRYLPNSMLCSIICEVEP